MNRFAYRTTSLAIKTLSNLTKARINLHGTENIPSGSKIFVINHFTRLETVLMPYYLYKLINVPVWSLASPEFFVGSYAGFLNSVGAISTTNPDRDLLVVKTLLTGEAAWMIFPEGRMVKNKKIIEKGRFMVSYAGGKHPPHTGAATLAIRTEFYRQRILAMAEEAPEEAQRLVEMFQISSVDEVAKEPVYIVPVNLTYYPVRAKENVLSRLAEYMVGELSERLMEEIMTEGAMLISGVDIDIRFGAPICATQCVCCSSIHFDIHNPAHIDFDDAISSVKRMRKEALKMMQRYMEAIYGMTTVNHDHLFAATLKKAPFSLVNEDNLKRRVFLITQNMENAPIHLHHSLSEDQIHLLTDDRYGKYYDFISLAMEKGIVQKNNGSLTKDDSKLSTLFDFHRSRVDNPIAVIANEVEPLPWLQRRISRVGWLPTFWLKRKVVRCLLESAQKEFNEDYQKFKIEDESKPKSVGQPYLLKGRRRDLGVVLVHGYMAAPLEVRTLAEHLSQKRGFWVYVPRLKGHGTAPEDLAQTSYQNWIDSVDRGYAVMANMCQQVVAGGFSTGAGLALNLATKVKLAGVFAVSTPLRLQYFASRFVPAVDIWNRIMKKVRLDDAKKEFVENDPENPHINYLRNPISGVRELERLMDVLEPKLSKIKIPTLVVQSVNDPVVDPKGSERIFKLIGAEDKQFVMFSFDRHGILLGEGSQRVHRTIGDFIEQLAQY
ncbi:MAG: alpha/beta fold hydrolase [Desulfobacteraceae bacterium]|jgi:esterase/lipase/1-acyl-sn-glycerol-3-phosphate acyltransferase